MRSTFLNYSASIEHGTGRHVVTAEYKEGYEVLSYHKTKAEAVAACKRYTAADKRRASPRTHR
jgi:hypothetical protein